MALIKDMQMKHNPLENAESQRSSTDFSKYKSCYSRMRISIQKQTPDQTHFGWGTATQNGMGLTKIVVKPLLKKV